jgi:tetratricopeptide (TPR) repeat protein
VPKNNEINSFKSSGAVRFWKSISQATKALRRSLRRKFWANTPVEVSRSNGFARLVRRIFRKPLEFAQPSKTVAYKPIANVNSRLTTSQLLNPILWMKWSASFALNWLLSRPFANILAAIPAITLGIGLGTVILFSTTNQSQNRASRYRSLFDDSVKNCNYEVASVVLRSLIDSSPQNLELKYQQALIEELRGNMDLALRQMDVLATSQNHGLAAMWMISKESNLQELKKWTEPKHARFRQLIEIGLKNLDGENLLSAKVLMFSYLAEIGAYSDAGRYLSEVVPARPELALAAATLCRAQHDATGVAKYATIAERHFESELSRHPTDINARINLARALMIRTRFEDAAKLLNDGYRLTKDSRLTGVTGEALLVWSNYLGTGDENSKNLVKRLQILHAAIGVAPSDPAVGSAIAQLIIDCRDNRLPEVNRLKEAVLAGTDPVATHFIRGTLALLDGKFEEAKSQLELALQREPNAPTILNNLAVAIAQMKAGDLEKALSLVDVALTKLPNHTYFLETRGQILVKLERWHEAIPNLEAALEAKELRAAIYPSLALAYEKIGATDIAQFYQNLVKEKA